jgi:hypothetical protein
MRSRWVLASGIALVALVVLTPTALAQAAESDANTMSACEADWEGRTLLGEDGPEVGSVFQAVCPITVALHLREALGAAGEFFTLIWLALWVVPILAWLVILLWRVLPRRYLKVRVARNAEEVPVGDAASFLVTIENRRKRRPVDVELTVTRPPQGWAASLAVEKPLPSGFRELLGEEEAMRVPLTARKTGANVADVRVVLKAPASAGTEESAEVELSVIPYIKDEPSMRRAKEVRLVGVVKPRESHPVIRSVQHEPRQFRVHDRILTTVILENRGDGPIAELPVRFFVNGEEHGERRVTIPASGETLIEFPWTATALESRVRVAIGG